MLTIKQKELLSAIQWYINEHDLSPTVRELCKLVNNTSTATVFNKLLQLEKKGYITSINGKSRTIKVIREVE